VNYVSFVDEAIYAEIAARPPGESVRLLAVLEDMSEIGAAAKRAVVLVGQVRATPAP
jgi:hypothetical protein